MCLILSLRILNLQLHFKTISSQKDQTSKRLVSLIINPSNSNYTFQFDKK